MIRLASDTSFNEWAKRFLEQLLDDAYLPSLQALRQEKWAALPVADSMGVMEAEWLAEAVHAMGITEVVGVAFEFNSDPEVEILQAGRDALLKYNHANGHANVCMTSRSLDFLYFKEQNNRFFLLCGRATLRTVLR